MADSINSVMQIDADWLTRALQSSGAISGRVASVSVEPIAVGVGLMGELGRLTIEYAGSETAPTTMVAKCAAQSPENKGVGQFLDFYGRETNFYNLIGDECPMRVPGSYFARLYPDTYDCAILMEDLGNVSPRDQIIGASEDDVLHAVENVADLHAKYWDKAGEGEFSWMYDFTSKAEAQRLQESVYQPALEPAIANFPELVNDEMAALLRNVGKNFVHYWSVLPSPKLTFVHGDYRQDNLLYIDSDEGTRSVVMDWQISCAGRGAFDVTYFMCQSLQPDLRKAIEKEALGRYHQRLMSQGVKDYSFDDCWRDYRVLMLGCLVYPITVCGTLDLGNERGRGLATVMMERNLKAIQELDCQEFLTD